MGFRFGIDQLCLFGLDPVEHVRLADELGCGWVSMAPKTMQENIEGYPPFDLATNAALRREVKAVLADTGIALGCGEGFLVLPGMDVGLYGAGLDAMAELGCAAINVLSVEQDKARAGEQIARLMGMVDARDMRTIVEFVPGLYFSALGQTLGLLDAMGKADVPVVIDAWHLFCSGGGAADVEAMDKSRFAYVQLCDTQPRPLDASYGVDAVYDRDAPGDGSLPIVELLKVVPDGCTLSFEVPQKAKALAGVPIHERMRHCLDNTKRLLAEAGRA
jgi:sugar phosphate isomerase/epimerase